MSDPKQKRRLTSLSWIVSIEGGALVVPGERMKKEIAEVQDTPDARLSLAPLENPKTHRQLRTFHGCIVPQVQDYYMEFEGIYKSVDRVKHELKEQFLQKQKRYWDDGSPVIIKITHPTKPNVSMEWHFEELPSLASLSIDQARSFIDHIIDYFHQEKKYPIVIDPALADPKFQD